MVLIMNAVRVAMSALVLLVVSVSVVGWIWVGSHQARAQSIASRIVLTMGMTGGLIGLREIWRDRATK